MKKSYEGGFTLIELIIALSIITIAMFLVSIRIQFENIILKGEANNVVSALRYTRQLDINGEFTQNFVLKTKGGDIYYMISDLLYPPKTYLCKKLNTNIIVGTSASVNINDEGVESDVEYIKVNKNYSEIFTKIRFTRNAAAGGGTIILKGLNTSKSYKITVVPTSGRVYLYEIDEK